MMADDMGIGDVGVYGQSLINTPHMDALAADGMRFTHCYAGSTVCAPSRSVLLTGQHTGHTRVRDNYYADSGGVGPKLRVPLYPEDVTVAEVLQAAGYATCVTGKWGLGEPDTTGIPTRQGFDEWFGYLSQSNAHSYYPEYLWHNEQQVPLPGNLDGARGTWSHDLMMDFALDFISGHAHQPFFLYGSFTLPHADYDIPDLGPYADMPWSDDEKAYAAMVSRFDDDLGQIRALLRNLGIERDTLIFCCSDNGPWEGLAGRFNSAMGLRGAKTNLYEGGIRAPMIVSWPGHVPAGPVSTVPWYFGDFMPTAAELAGVQPSAEHDGISLVPHLLGGSGQDIVQSRDYFYWEYPARYAGAATRCRALIRDGWKVVEPAPDAPLELYHLDVDPGETTNLAADNPSLTAELAGLMDEAHVDSPHWEW
jgi:arylsulfatase A-like enzyme